MRADRTAGLLASALRGRGRDVAALLGWAAVEALPAYVSGRLVASAIDRGFLAGRPWAGFVFLGVFAASIVVGAWGARRTFGRLTVLVEPFRDELVRTTVTAAIHRSTAGGGPPDAGAVSRLTRQVEIAREALAGLLVVAQGFVVTMASALAGLLTLVPSAAMLVLPPLAAGIGLFVVALRRMTASKRAAILADEGLAVSTTAMATGLRDVVASGGEDAMAREVGGFVEAEAAATCRVARLATVGAAAVGIGGWLPVVLLLAGGPWLRRHGATTGALLGALTYVLEGVLPALQSLVRELGETGAWLTVALRRITEGAASRSGSPGQPPPDSVANAGDGPAPSGGVRAGSSSARLAAEPAAALGSPESRGRSTESVGGAGSPGKKAPGPFTPAGPERPSIPAGPRNGALSSGSRSAPERVAARLGNGTAVPGRAPRDGYEVVVRDLTFRYGVQAEPIVAGLDLVLPEGDHLAVVGPSGAGKSTLAALMAGMLRPQDGEVLIGGIPVLGAGRSQLSARRVLIPQEAYVFAGSLRENLSYLDPSVPDATLDAAVDELGARRLVERIERAAAMAGAGRTRSIEAMADAGPTGNVAVPSGYDALVEPASLSAGERQLLSLVRAFVAPAPVVLLDEATCHLDPAAEEVVERAFAWRPGTLVVVAHRISSALRARRILVIDGAEVLVGAHDDLLVRSPLYRDLVGYWTFGKPSGEPPRAGASPQAVPRLP